MESKSQKTTSSQEWLTNGIICLPHLFAHNIVIVGSYAGMIYTLIVLSLLFISTAAKDVCYNRIFSSHCCIQKSFSLYS